MKIPDWFQLLVLSAAAFRVWRLLAEDDILDAPRRSLLRLGNWRQEGDPIPANCRLGWSRWLGCYWCCGFWVALAWWGAWQWSQHWTMVIAVPWAISALVGGIAKATES